MFYNNIAELKVCVEGKVLVFPDPFPTHLKMAYSFFYILGNKRTKDLVG